MTTVYVGLDPGVTGAVAVILPDGTMTCRPLKTRLVGKQKYLDSCDLETWLGDVSEGHSAHACIELVHSMPRQGVTSTFTFGAAWGAGVAALELFTRDGGRLHILRTDEWRKHVGLPRSVEKDAVLDHAARLWPMTKFGRNHNLAEAALMAEAARRIDGAGQGVPCGTVD